jgi:tetratricopeptide (TPR) repeat protein
MTKMDDAIRKMDERDFEGALKIWTLLLSKSPVDQTFRRNAAICEYNLGNQALDIKNYAAAIEFYKKAIDLDPSYHEPLYNIGLALGYANRHDEAKVAFSTAIAANQSDPQPHLALGTLHLGLEEISAAIPELERFLQLAPDDKNAPAVRRVLDRYRS